MLDGIYIDNVTKNSGYRVRFFIADGASSYPQVVGKTGLASLTAKKISKDDAAFGDITDSLHEIGQGWYYYDLSATEMNANNIMLFLRSSGNSSACIWIKTTTSSGSGITAQQVWEYGTRSLTESGDGLSLDTVVTGDAILSKSNPTVGDILYGIYFFFKKNKRRTL